MSTGSEVWRTPATGAGAKPDCIVICICCEATRINGSVEITTIDGLGRLKSATETLTKADNSTIAHTSTFGYDSLSQLTSAAISNIGQGSWTANYEYQNNGDMDERTINFGTPDTFYYVGNEMRTLNSNGLSYDENGNLIAAPKDASSSMTLEYNWENKLRSAKKHLYDWDFVHHEVQASRGLDDTAFNCATWVNSMFKAAGVHRSIRNEAGEFNGFDWGEENLIDESYFR
ncbi:MAG: hypothetical protein ABFD79_01660 [Phycisphaerales bacterium]